MDLPLLSGSLSLSEAVELQTDSDEQLEEGYGTQQPVAPPDAGVISFWLHHTQLKPNTEQSSETGWIINRFFCLWRFKIFFNQCFHWASVAQTKYQDYQEAGLLSQQNNISLNSDFLVPVL